MMKKKIYYGVGLLAVLLAAFLWAGCRTTALVPPNTIVDGGVLRIAYSEIPPFIMKTSRGIEGIEADLGRLLAERLGATVKFVYYPFNKIDDALLAGRVDMIMAGMTITDLRRVRMEFSDPYIVVGQMALTRIENVHKFNSDVKIRSANATVGVVAGSIGEQLVETYFINARRSTYKTPSDAVQELKNHRLDFVLYDAPSVWWYAAQNDSVLSVAGPLLTQEEIGWAMRRESPYLREAVNAALKEWAADGTLDAVFHRWGIPYSKL